MFATRVCGSYTRSRFGVAVRDVTPPVGIYHRSWGAATHDRSEGVHRPCTATAAVFAPLDASGPTLALVGLDYGWFQNMADEAELRARVRERTGLREAELLVNLSHTHASANANSALAARPGGDLIRPYLARLADAVAGAIEEARGTLRPAWLTWGQGRCALAANRDYWDAERGRWACGFNPEGTADDTVLVGRATADDGAVLATIVNYACHPTTLAWDNRLLSPDFVGAMREVLEGAFGAPALFLQGASGELGPREGYTGDTAVADRNGRILGHAAAAAIEALPPAGSTYAYTGIVTSGADIGTWAYRPATEAELAGSAELAAEVETVALRRKPYRSAGEIEAELAAQPTNGPHWERLQRSLLIARALGDTPEHQMPLWTWRLGQAALVAVPNELYSAFQSSLRARFPGLPLLVLGDTNGWLGYICPVETYGTGRYQEWQSPYAPGCLEQTIDAAAARIALYSCPAS